MPSTTKPSTATKATTKPKASTTKATKPKASTTTAAKAKAEAAAAAKAAAATPAPKARPYVPEGFVAGEAPKGFERYCRLLRTNGHAVAEYQPHKASSADELALVADLATALGGPANLGRFVVVDWSGGTIAGGFDTHALAYAYTCTLGGRTDLARAVVASVGEVGLADLSGRIGAEVVARPAVEAEVVA